MWRFGWILILVLSCWVTGPREAQAVTEGQRLSLDELVMASDGVFLGKVVALQAARARDGESIVTLATVKVSTALKGRAGKDGTVQLELPGGQLGNEIEIVGGAPRVAQDQEILVFAQRQAKGGWQVVGQSQGVYEVTLDNLSSKRYALRDLSGVYLLVKDPAYGMVRSVEATREHMPLEDLLAAVANQVEAPLVRSDVPE